jgi:predicted nucleotidyltransferase
MRLTEKQVEQIRSIGREVFGSSVRIYLFGSRVDDHKRGGDIDLLIEPETKPKSLVEARIRFLVRLKQAIGDQKIDLVFPESLASQPEFENSINNHRIRIC